MSAFKQLTLQDFYLSDYLAKKRWFASGSFLTDYKVETLRGFSGSTPGYPYPNDYRNDRYQKLVFDSVTHNFYKITSGSISGSTIFSGSYDVDFQTTLDLSGSRIINNEVGIISIPKEVAGIGIEPGSFMVEPTFEDDDKFMEDGYARNSDDGTNQYIENIEFWYNSNPYDTRDYLVSESNYVEEDDGEYLDINNNQQRWEIIDDGEGRLVISGAADFYTRPERHVGDIIYNKGLAIFTDDVVARYYSTYSRHKLHWKSKQPIYTYNVYCTVRESELNHTFNPSALTGSDNTVRDNITGSQFRPYITTVGLYNEANELLAVAKTNRPIPKSENVDMTFVIKLDV